MLPVQHHVREATRWVLSGWFDLDYDQVEEVALGLVDEAMGLIDERITEETQNYLTERDVALVAVALAVERIAGDQIVLDWFPGDVIRFIEREARVRKALAQRAD